MENSFEQLFEESKAMLESQPDDFVETLRYTIIYNIDPQISELIDYLSSPELQYRTTTRI